MLQVRGPCQHYGGAETLMLEFQGDPDRVSKPAFSPPVAGVIYLDVPFWYDRTKPVRQKTIRSYYGSDDESVWGVSLLMPLNS
jgi:prenylcysteine alpha-carboxyl methylesterase